MPTYEYTCDECHHDWEKFQSIKEAPVRVCPKCGKARARRLISQGSFVLKGKGWAKQGYSYFE